MDKHKNTLGKNERIVEKSDRNKGIGLTMPITMPIIITLITIISVHYYF